MDNTAAVGWASLKTTLRTLYLEQDLSLAEVMHEMASKYKFNATKSQYELQFKKWQFRKNRTAEEWKIVARKLMKRKRENKESEVVLNGKVLNPKKLRKETMRYGSVSAAIKNIPQCPSPTTPEGFIIRTPPPKFTTCLSTTTEFPYIYPSIYPSINIISVPMDCLPFYQFNSVFSRAENPFLCIPKSGRAELISLLNLLKERDNKAGSRSLTEFIKALTPENIFLSNPTADVAMSQVQRSSTLHFLNFTMYLVSNNLFNSATLLGEKVYKWIKQCLNADLLEYIFSIGGPTVEALTENLFRLAIDAEDVHTIKHIINLGIDPNEQLYRVPQGYCITPIVRACQMQSLKLVGVLIEGGARVDHSLRENDTGSTLMSVLYNSDIDGKIKHVDTELVRILLDAGAIVNPGLGQSPLASAAKLGHVEAVELLVSAGADVNGSIGSYYRRSPPLIMALSCQYYIPDTDVISMVRILLNAGADVQVVGGRDFSPETTLECAMGRENIELIGLLLENGARVTDYSFAAAVRLCDINVVKLLLKFGGQVTPGVIESAVERDSNLVLFLLEILDDRTKKECKSAALIKSIECGKIDLIRTLVASGTQLKRSSLLETHSQLRRAIREVVRRGDMDVLRFLLDEKSGHGALLLASLGPALLTAITNGRNDMVELLLMAGADINSADKDSGDSPLLAAIRRRDSHLAKQLLVAGAVVNGTDNRPFSAHTIPSTLPAVVEWGYYPLIQDIINAGAEIDAPMTKNGKTALVIAIEKKDTEAIKLLIDAGADVNTPMAAISGNTALKAASRNNDLQMVQYLLGLGADPDECSLMVAISGSLELVQTLLAARLNRYKRISRSYGCHALQCAIKLKNSPMIEVLLAKGIDPNTIIHQKPRDRKRDLYSSDRASLSSLEPRIIPSLSAFGSAIKWDKSEDSWIVRMLLRGGADPNSIVTGNQQTPLLVAIYEENLALVKILIAAGADVNPNLRFGVKRTPLQHAVEKGQADIVKLLLEHGANINAPPCDRYGATALQFAAIGGYVPIASLLIDRGADVNASPAKIGGRTALEGAAEHGRIDMLQLLLSAGALIIGTGAEQYDRARKLALDNCHRAACRLLEKYSADMSNIIESWDDTDMDLRGFGRLSA